MGADSRPSEAWAYPVHVCSDDALCGHLATEGVSGRLFQQGNDNRCPAFPRQRGRKTKRHSGANHSEPFAQQTDYGHKGKCQVAAHHSRTFCLPQQHTCSGHLRPHHQELGKEGRPLAHEIPHSSKLCDGSWRHLYLDRHEHEPCC